MYWDHEICMTFWSSLCWNFKMKNIMSSCSGFCFFSPLMIGNFAERDLWPGVDIACLLQVKLWKARSRLYQRRFLQPNINFCSVFRDLQDLHSFAPLYIQNLQIKSLFVEHFFCKISGFCRWIFFVEICHFSSDFDENFSEFHEIF